MNNHVIANRLIAAAIRAISDKFRIFVLLLLLVSANQWVFAAGHGDVIILNSDLSVLKYRLAQSTFESSYPGKTVSFDLGDGNFSMTAEFEKSLRDTKSDIIYAIGSKAYNVAQNIFANRKIIFSSIINWQRFEVTPSSYGIANELPAGMQLTIYRYFFPQIKKIGIIYSELYNKEWLESAVEAGRELNIDIIGETISKTDGLLPALNKILPQVDALWLISEPLALSSPKSVSEILELSNAFKKPVFAYREVFADLGATLAISADIPTMARQAAEIAIKLATGSAIENRVLHPAGSQIILNKQKIGAYGIELNAEAMDSVNRIIE